MSSEASESIAARKACSGVGEPEMLGPVAVDEFDAKDEVVVAMIVAKTVHGRPQGSRPETRHQPQSAGGRGDEARY